MTPIKIRNQLEELAINPLSTVTMEYCNDGDGSEAYLLDNDQVIVIDADVLVARYYTDVNYKNTTYRAFVESESGIVHSLNSHLIWTAIQTAIDNANNEEYIGV
ncbi:hypothetical protein VPHD479_0073 [Vibrio phage D479]